MPTLSYDLHVHPGPSAAPRWGDGRRVWAAAVAAGVHGFVWKAHERHTADVCRELPREPVRAIASASLNPWASLADVVTAVESGARWVWGPTTGDDGRVAWDLPLPGWWAELAEQLPQLGRRLVLATGHLAPAGRAELAALARSHEHLVCSVTHSLFVGAGELVQLHDLGCRFEIDAYTLAVQIPGRDRMDVERLMDVLPEAEQLVYFTSDGGQQTTGDPFLFGAAVLDDVAARIGPEPARKLGIHNPEALVSWLDGGRE
jgi:hypothetical protein